MEYRYSIKDQKGSFVMQISCANCKKPIFIYQKRGPGGLLKIHPSRIIESELDIEALNSTYECPDCKFELAVKTTQKSKLVYRVVRGHVHTKKLPSYRYK
ncbi:MAG: hypothetical protein Q4P29_06120 [Tissierellia bacterium]|nr:hypothetical protein [Tissierellia bacterium]